MIQYTVGNSDQDWTLRHAFRGNLYTASASVVLVRFEMLLDPQEPCELRFVVCSAPAGRRFTIDWTTTQKAKPGRKLWDSGRIDLPTVPGRRYGIGIGWNNACRFYSGQYGTFDDFDAGVGRLVGSLFDNTYNTDEGVAPQDVGPRPSACYHQRLSM